MICSIVDDVDFQRPSDARRACLCVFSVRGYIMRRMRNRPLNLEDVLQDRRTEEDLLEVPLANRVFKTLGLILAPLFLILAGQLVSLNVVQGDAFKARAFANMSDVKIREAPRGVIVDRFGKPLLHNEPSEKVLLSPHDFPQDPALRVAALEQVSAVMGMDYAALAKQIEEKDWGQSDELLLTDNATHDELVALSSLNLPGIDIEPGFKRAPQVPYAFSPILGYTGLVNASDLKNDPNLSVDDTIGRAGLERSYDHYLRGTNGEQISVRNAGGKLEQKQSVKAPQPGNMLETNIDSDLQQYMYSRLAEGLQTLGRNVGAAIAINPQNGQVLGLVDIPTYDASDIASALSQPNNPLFNRAVSGLYNPGSTIKPLHASAILTEGIITPEKQIFSKGYIEVPNPYDPAHPSRFVDWKPNGWVDVHTALARSCNIYFYETIGGYQDQQGLGITKLKQWWQRFRLDQKTGIDLPGEASGLLPDPAWKERVKGEPWRLGDTYNVAIGQGDIAITPIELLDYIGAIANGGKIYEPQIVKNIKDAQGNVVKAVTPVVTADLSSLIGKALPHVQEGMREVAEAPFGTAAGLSQLPIEVAAKTGTAQVLNNTQDNAFFVGYAPYKNPQIALIVLVENSREGSLNTIPIAKDILLWYYEHRLKGQTAQ